MALTKVSTAVVDLSSDNSSLDIPKGTTAEAPGVGTATVGSVRFNTDDGAMQVYTTADGWINLKSNIPPPPFTLEYLSVSLPDSPVILMPSTISISIVPNCFLVFSIIQMFFHVLVFYL